MKRGEKRCEGAEVWRGVLGQLAKRKIHASWHRAAHSANTHFLLLTCIYLFAGLGGALGASIYAALLRLGALQKVLDSCLVGGSPVGDLARKLAVKAGWPPTCPPSDRTGPDRTGAGAGAGAGPET